MESLIPQQSRHLSVAREKCTLRAPFSLLSLSERGERFSLFVNDSHFMLQIDF